MYKYPKFKGGKQVLTRVYDAWQIPPFKIRLGIYSRIRWRKNAHYGSL